MLTDEQIMLKLEPWLNSREEAGEKAGGSRHLSFVSYKVNEILNKEKKPEGWHIDFSYTQYIETEFTYYPDNPPYEYSGKIKILMTFEGEILKKIEE